MGYVVRLATRFEEHDNNTVVGRQQEGQLEGRVSVRGNGGNSSGGIQGGIV